MAVSFKPRTRYVAGRLQQTAWADRRIIHDLLTIENYLSGCPCGGWHSIWVRRGLMTRYPVEAVIIRHELLVGVQLTEQEARQWLQDEATARLAQDAARMAHQRAERDQMEREAFEEWLNAGGLP